MAGGFAEGVGGGPELGVGFEEFDDGGGGDAQEFGDVADAGSAGVEEVEDEGGGAGVVFGVGGDGEAPELDDLGEPCGGLPAAGVDRVADFDGEAELEAAEGTGFVLGLRAGFAGEDGDAGGGVGEANGAAGLVALLSAGAGAAEEIEAAFAEEGVVGDVEVVGG